MSNQGSSSVNYENSEGLSQHSTTASKKPSAATNAGDYYYHRGATGAPGHGKKWNGPVVQAAN